MTSKPIDKNPSINLTELVPSLKFNEPDPLIITSTIVYKVEKNPPVKSIKILNIDHPLVDFLLKLRIT